MRVRRFQLRLLASTLVGLWALAGGLVLIGYRPGGPIDLVVGLLALLPVGIALAAFAWPPVARDGRTFVAIAWIGIGAALLLVPSIGGVLNQIAGRGAQTLLPSPEAAYPWVLALAATSLLGGLGVARRVLGQAGLRRRRVGVGIGIAILTTFAVASAFGAVAVANDVALRDRPAITSRFGPTSTDVEPPLCDAPLSPSWSATLAMEISGEIDLRSIGGAQLRGVRQAADVRWTANVATDRELGLAGVARLADGAWMKAPRGPWLPAEPASIDPWLLDARVVGIALAAENRTAAEDRGLEFVEGARGRHCRIAIDGPTFTEAFPQVTWLAGQDDLGPWRGQLDYWIFVGGQVGRIDGRVNGEASRIAPEGILGTIRVTMTATDRDRSVSIVPPIR